MTKMTAGEIKNKIDYEGFDYFFRYYIEPNQLPDSLVKLATKYRDVAQELEEAVEELENAIEELE